tara:strand:+ start:4306 stop:4815 length:510 start_codon:yes stop_codon:yes gene_type:complete
VIPLWWDILKEAKLSGKPQGSTLNTNRIKINTDDNDCKEKLRKLIWFNTTEPAPDDIAQQVDTIGKGNALIVTKEFNKLPEEIACKVLETIKRHEFDGVRNFTKKYLAEKYGNTREKNLGDNYRLWVGLDYNHVKANEDTIRYYIFNGTEDVAWVMFPFSDLQKWKDAQ